MFLIVFMPPQRAFALTALIIIDKIYSAKLTCDRLEGSGMRPYTSNQHMSVFFSLI